MKLAPLLQKVGFYLVAATVALIPLFFLPVTPDFYEFNKNILLIVLTSAAALVWAVSSIMDRQIRLTRSPLGLPILGFAAVWILSAFFRSPVRFTALFDPNQTVTIVFLSLFFFVVVNLVRTKSEITTLLSALIGSLGILALISIVWGSGLLASAFGSSYLASSIWTPTGNTLSTLLILASAIPFLALLVVTRSKTASSAAFTVISGIVLLACVLSTGILAYRLFQPGSANRPLMLDQFSGWVIAMESLKASPILGTGPASFVNSFNLYRPFSFNLQPQVWNIRFSTSSNSYLHILSTLGLLGLITYAFIIFRSSGLLLRSVKSASDSPLRLITVASLMYALLLFAIQFFTVASFTHMFLIFVLLGISIAALKQLGYPSVHEANIDIVAASSTGEHTPILPWIALLVIIALVAPSLYFNVQSYYGDILYKRALDFAAANRGKETYDTLIQAINTNPYRDNYRVAYSQTNLLLANNIAAKTELTAEERDTISKLIQQSIREARNAVTLNAKSASNWENLASIYRTLVALAQGADQWTVAAYNQAIALDPVNPNLRVALGGVLYSQKNYDQAIRLFSQATDLKSDYANAYYNLAAAYREKGDYANAAAAMQLVVNYIDKASADYPKALEELDQLRAKVTPAAAVSATPTPAPVKTSLQAPQPQPTAKINPPIKLPEDLGPQPTSAPSPAVSPLPTP